MAGSGYDPARVKRAHATHRLIMTAVAAGSLSPARAAHWARRAARGEDVSVIRNLTPVGWLAETNRGAVLAHSNQQVLDILTSALYGPPASSPDDEDEALDPSLWPPGAIGPGGHYEPPRTPLVYQDGTPVGTTASPYTPYASAPAEPMSDAEADALWPPRSRQEAERRHRAREIAAGRVFDYSTDEIHAMIFGDTSGDSAG